MGGGAMSYTLLCTNCQALVEHPLKIMKVTVSIGKVDLPVHSG